ncbi:MAG: shikimate kinase [Micrococcus sp.]|nr:shikimate kinase [Micrococcus sp.]
MTPGTDDAGTAPSETSDAGPEDTSPRGPAQVGSAAWHAMTEAVHRDLTRPRVPNARLWRWRMRRSIVLVGPMGAGKSAVGRLVGRLCGRAHVDADAVFVQVHGSIPDFFATFGEPEFRRAEEEVLAHLLGQHVPFVLSCGGGAVVSEATRRRLIASDALVVHLDVDERHALQRVRGGANRPVLRGDPRGTWSRLQRERDPLYREVADLHVDTSGLATEDVAWRIVEEIRHPSKGSDRRP